MAEDSPDLTVLIIAEDPLVQTGIEQVLRQEGVEAAYDRHRPADLATNQADVCVWDFATPPALPSSGLPPVLALAQGDDEARAALAWGALGVLHRSQTRLAGAMYAVADEHNVIGSGFSHLVARDEPVPHIEVRLTPREQEVLALLSDGLSNQGIADELSVSVHTARFHVQSVLDKLGAETRTEAVALAFRSGLVEL